MELKTQWNTDPEASSALLIPMFSVYFIWMQRHSIKRILADAPETVFSKSGFGLLLAGLIMFILGKFTYVVLLQGFAFVIIVSASILFLYGKEIFKITLVPALFLLFMLPIPSPVYGAVAEKLKYIIAHFSTVLIASLNIPVFLDGNVINLPSGSFLVHETCSGIQTTIAIIIVSSGFAYLFLGSYLYRMVFIGVSVPLGILVNILRVAFIGIISYWYDAAAALSFHRHAWALVTPLGVLSVFAIGVAFRKCEKRNIL
ncbi:MAG: exosortase/archaeosortase family protein [Nitrospirae bacterium]|nr:exosortase/archaeosortase family protein [Nitrospirota bacterium]